MLSVGDWHCKRRGRAEYEKFVSQFAIDKFSAHAFVAGAEEVRERPLRGAGLAFTHPICYSIAICLNRRLAFV